tara:strand:- start:140 stop:283 length:144 start_codon:yes stop_codon:yes gene_type:complete
MTKRWKSCTECGSDEDLFVNFSKHQVCGDCTELKYKKATRGGHKYYV